MKFIATISLCLIGLSALAQKNDIGKYQIKLYALTTTNAIGVNSTYNRSQYATSYVFFNHILNPTFAVNKQTNKGNRHEVELTALGINETTNRTTLNNNSSLFSVSTGAAVRESKFAARYEYIYVFMKNKRLQPSIGAALSPYYVKYNFAPLSTSVYPFRESAFGIQTFIIPRISYSLNKRFFVDLNVPLKITENQFSSRQEYNPTEQNNTSNNTSFTALEYMFYARLGIGINI